MTIASANVPTADFLFSTTNKHQSAANIFHPEKQQKKEEKTNNKNDMDNVEIWC